MTDSRVIKPGLFGLNVAADGKRAVYDAQNEQLLVQGTVVDAVFIGDSITEMWQLDAYFRGQQGVLVNRGIGGDVTPYIRRRFMADAMQLRPRLVVLLAGINNFWDLDNWMNPSLVRMPQEIEDEVVNDIDAMVEVARKEKIEVAVCSVLPTNILFNSNEERRNMAIQRINTRLQKMAGERGAMFVDYHRRFVAKDGVLLRDGVADDGLHPQAQGYKEMADILLGALEAAGCGILRAR